MENEKLPMRATLKDSGQREKMATGSQRDSREGKGRFDLLPANALFRLCRIFEAGAIKYNCRNWELGQPLSRYIDSGLRHVFCMLKGMKDEDHVAQAVWNFMCFIETQDRIRAGLLPASLDDLPANPSDVRNSSEDAVLKKLRDALAGNREIGVVLPESGEEPPSCCKAGNAYARLMEVEPELLRSYCPCNK